jgi:hypothetical protein
MLSNSLFIVIQSFHALYSELLMTSVNKQQLHIEDPVLKHWYLVAICIDSTTILFRVLCINTVRVWI